MLCLSGFKLYSCWVPLNFGKSSRRTASRHRYGESYMRKYSLYIPHFFAYKAQHFFNKCLLDSSNSVVMSGCVL